ncbi:alpha-(1-_3)-arabinofuranosyltransferase domain-containing protein [Tomitella biformata]|uniref:alpha-(1->3)-arabinofuranosyltransferase domain-containing protein n=1 Tax=Tomitella biformata TaxID=630403 RepID=UPI0004655AE0
MRAGPVPRRWLWIGSVVAFLLAFLQAPGQLAADTKLDLTANPLGFLARATHQWSSIAPLGQVQNQAYGYFFPHGSFFALGQLAHIPPWITQRLWWAVLLAAGFWGLVRVADALGIGSRSSRVLAAAVFALSPRVLTTIGSISSESLPMLLAPWVLLPVILALNNTDSPHRAPRSMRVLAAQSAVAVALMGAVNAVATVAACLVAGLWWLAHQPNPRWRAFTAWWIPSLLLASLWWIVPLLLLGKVSPPFLDFIESSVTTTQWTSLTEVLRGTSSWAPFISPERAAGVALVSQPVMVLATGLLAATGLAGLCQRSMPARGRLMLILLVGLVGMGLGYDGALGSPIADTVRAVLDGAGAPLRNVHKLEPLIRIPLVLGLAHLLRHVPLPGSAPWRRVREAAAHPEHQPMTAIAALVLAALVLVSNLAWMGNLVPFNGYRDIPDHWAQAAEWLGENAAGTDPSQDVRALVVPGSGFAMQEWGLTRDEPLQPLAQTPWAVRDAIPLTPPGAIRALDSVQRLLAAGQPSDGLTATLLGQGIGYLVLRNDLDVDRAQSVLPVLAHQTIDGSPGLRKVAEFGKEYGAKELDDVVVDSDLRQRYPAIEIYQVGERTTVGPYTTPLAQVDVIAGGPEVLLRRNALRGETVRPAPVLLAADARAAGLTLRDVLLTDTPADRETDFGRVDNATSAIRSADDPRRTPNAAADYPAPGAELTHAEWEGAQVTVSSAASDPTQLGAVAPGSGPAAAFDGDPATSWISRGVSNALGQWLRLDFDTPINGGGITVRTSPATYGPAVTALEVQTPNGTSAVAVPHPGEPVDIALPPGLNPWVIIRPVGIEDGSAGKQFGLAEVAAYAGGVPVPIRHRVVLPPAPVDARVLGWSLGQDLPSRHQCVDSPEQALCGAGLAVAPEEQAQFSRTLSVPTDAPLAVELTVRTRVGEALDDLLTIPGAVTAAAPSAVSDPRGSALAATDGDPQTSWRAVESANNLTTTPPTLTLTLPAPQLVSSLRLTPSAGPTPANPQVVTINLGTGPQQRTVPADGLIEIAPAVTDRVQITIDSWSEVFDHSGLGFASKVLPGLAEVAVFTDTAGEQHIGALPDPERELTVGCEFGPTISMSGQILQTSITATAAQLRSGAPLRATVCGGQQITPTTGSQDLEVRPGPAFTVDGVELRAHGSAELAPAELTTLQPSHLQTTQWTQNRRVIDVAAATEDRLLVVPESTNTGWVATTADGTTLNPVVVDGWQQGWVLPAGADTTVTLAFPTDVAYRIALFGGLALLIPLFGLALVRRHAPGATGEPARAWGSSVAALAGVTAAAGLLSGLVGVLVVAVVAAALALRGRRRAALACGLAMMVAVTALASGPWLSPTGYAGHGALVQFAALVALVIAALSAVPIAPRVDAWLRRLSHRTRARRAGSSTNA